MHPKMKTKCEKCSRELKLSSYAYICIHECTFCAECAREMNYICPNCMGELRKRAKPEPKK
ncbi:MAG: DUF1272 domain-containing protein [Chlorobi bacterium]|nr:DUF1272 domain-containing protein [Chlorobiota bacterium]